MKYPLLLMVFIVLGGKAVSVHASIVALYQRKLIFSSGLLIKEYLVRGRPLNAQTEDILANLVANTGTILFVDLPNNVLRNYLRSPSLRLVLGLRLFQERQYNDSARVLRNLPPDHPFSIEKFFILGAIHGLRGKHREARRYYNLCREYGTRKRKGEKEGGHWEFYYRSVEEKCIIHSARSYYTQKKYQKSLETYRQVPKNSSHWPSLLLEKAWANFQKENYNRALGLLVTYKMPILKNYFTPEAEYLRAFSFLRLCYWDEARKISHEYRKKYYQEVALLRKLLLKNLESDSYFLSLIIKWIKKGKKFPSLPLIQGIMFRFSQEARFKLNLYAYLKLRREVKWANAQGAKLLRGTLISPLREIQNLVKIHLNHRLKKEMFTFVNQMNRFGHELLKVSALASSRERKELYRQSEKGPKKVKRRATKGSWGYIVRDASQQFYSFNGEFWLDELGEYSFGLKSKCLGKGIK